MSMQDPCRKEDNRDASLASAGEEVRTEERNRTVFEGNVARIVEEMGFEFLECVFIYVAACYSEEGQPPRKSVRLYLKGERKWSSVKIWRHRNWFNKIISAAEALLGNNESLSKLDFVTARGSHLNEDLQAAFGPEAFHIDESRLWLSLDGSESDREMDN